MVVGVLRFAGTSVAVIAALLLYPIVGVGACYLSVGGAEGIAPGRSFDSVEWKSDGSTTNGGVIFSASPRQRMVNDLVHSEILLNTTAAEVRSQLGDPTHDWEYGEGRLWSYALGAIAFDDVNYISVVFDAAGTVARVLRE